MKFGIELVKNEAGGSAIELSPVNALVQMSMTGCLNQTFYTSAQDQTDKILQLCEQVDPEMVAKIAVHSREKGYMKEVPALLCVWLAAKRRNDLLMNTFSRVINNGKMLRNFIKILRSGKVGRKSLGSLPKRLVGNWFNSRTTKEIFMQSVGDSPSFKDILRLSHPKPLDKSKNALYRWFLGREHEISDLPEIVQQFEYYKKGDLKEVPKIPFEMLTSLKLGQSEWCQIAMRANWHWLRMNLNTMKRHGVFDIPDMVNFVAAALSNKESILKAKVFPYQIMTAFKNTGNDIPQPIRNALQDALEIATENVPELPGNGYVLIDVSGSMAHPATGFRSGSTSVVKCIDVAGLIASSILRKNPKSHVMPFANAVKPHTLNERDTVLTNTDVLARMIGGGTNCSAPLKVLNDRKALGNWVIMVSDNQSWIDTLGTRIACEKTQLMQEWRIYKQRNPDAKFVAIDIQPFATTQVQSREDILNVGSFSDITFDVINLFLRDEMSADFYVEKISKIEL